MYLIYIYIYDFFSPRPRGPHRLRPGVYCITLHYIISYIYYVIQMICEYCIIYIMAQYSKHIMHYNVCASCSHSLYISYIIILKLYVYYIILYNI